MIGKRSDMSSIGTSAANVEAFLTGTKSAPPPAPDAAGFILAELAVHGPMAIDRLVAAARQAGISELGAILKALRDLAGAGLVEQPGGMEYRLTPAGRSVAASA